MPNSVAYFALHIKVGPTFVHTLGRVSPQAGPSTCVCVSEIGPYVGIRDTEILCFLLATYSPKEGKYYQIPSRLFGRSGR